LYPSVPTIPVANSKVLFRLEWDGSKYVASLYYVEEDGSLTLIESKDTTLTTQLQVTGWGIGGNTADKSPSYSVNNSILTYTVSGIWNIELDYVKAGLNVASVTFNLKGLTNIGQKLNFLMIEDLNRICTHLSQQNILTAICYSAY